jgi:hypothetical protein
MIRAFAIVLLGLSLAGCGLGIPQPTQQEVLQKDLMGTTWRYQGTTPTNCEITFNADCTYSLVRRVPGSAVTNSGRWEISSPYLGLLPSERISPVFERYTLIRWWFTPASANRVSLFGGDSLDPNHWAVLSRIGGESTLASRPVSTIAASQPAGEDLIRTIGYSLVAGLAVCFAASVGFRLWKALGKPRPAKRSPPKRGPAILPQLDRVRSKTARG